MTPTEIVSRLRRLANDWRKEEKQLCEQFGDEIIPRSMRARRIKDTKALEAAVEMIERTRDVEVAPREFTWGNDSESQADCAQSVLERAK